MPHAVTAALAVCLVVGGLSARGSEGATRIAVLPFQNVSGHVQSSAVLTPIMLEGLRARGYEVVSGRVLEPFLVRERIRNTGVLSHQQARAVASEFQVDGVLVGSIALYSEMEGNPQWGLILRLLDPPTGAIVWAASAGLTGEDFTGPLGLGAITDPAALAARLVMSVLRSLPPPGVSPVPGAAPGRDRFGFFWGGRAAAYRGADLGGVSTMRVAVLPFENTSERKGAAIIVTDIVVADLVERGARVIEPGEVAGALLALRAAPFGSIDLETVEGLRDKTGADTVVLGTVHEYNEGIQRGGTTSPSVSLDIRMLDTHTGRILWSAHHQGEGDGYQIALDFGKIRSMVALVKRVVAEMFSTL